MLLEREKQKWAGSPGFKEEEEEVWLESHTQTSVTSSFCSSTAAMV